MTSRLRGLGVAGSRGREVARSRSLAGHQVEHRETAHPRDPATALEHRETAQPRDPATALEHRETALPRDRATALEHRETPQPRDRATALKIITNCGACEPYIGRCIDSLRTQTFEDWEAFVTVDPCGDATYERALDAARGDARIHVVRNERRLWAMENVVRAVARSGDDPDDVLIVVDGDDWLATSHALATIAAAHADDECWMTYGSWVSSIDPDDGRWGPYPAGTRDFRTASWRGTAVRTWKRWLWDAIDDRDLRDEDGRYFRIVEDRAYMLPMLEMATTRRARHIAEALLIYNRGNPLGVGKVMLDEMYRCTAVVHARPPYRPLPEKSVHNQPTAGVSLVTQHAAARR